MMMAPQKIAREPDIMARVTERVAMLEKAWQFHATRPGKALVIRPRVPGDDYTTLGSNVWGANAKQKALDEGWDVVDLDANAATRAAIEAAITNEQPDLVLHFDHGSAMTMWGQDANALQAGIDDVNVHLASGRIASTVSCDTASGLGPAAIGAGVRAYLGYTLHHIFWTPYQDEFGVAANAANYALLECKTMQQAFDAGWAAYDQLYNDLLAMGGAAANLVAPSALHDRDCFALLGTASAVACPLVLHCMVGLPDTVMHCMKGAPDQVLACRYGLPLEVLRCRLGLPDTPIIECSSGLPDTELLVCKAGPEFGPWAKACAAGPSVLVLKEELVSQPEVRDWVVIDMSRVPRAMQKPLRQMLDQIRREG
jgi:hypothetical protein